MDQIILNKKKYRVGFKGESPNIIINKVEGGKDVISGIFYDVWRIFKNKYKIDAEEIVIDDTIEWNRSNTNLCKDIARGKYDFIVGNFSILPERKALVHFTRPVQLNKVEVGFIPKVSKIKMFFQIFYRNILFPLVFLLTIGIVLGYTLFTFDKGRGKRRAIFSTIASLFGEMGYVAERSNLTFGGMFVAFIIMLVSYYFTIYLQAVTVGDIIELTNSEAITKENISSLNPVLVAPDLASTKILESYGAKTVVYDHSDKNTKDAPFMESYVKHYLKNQDKYCGYLKDFSDYSIDKVNYGVQITDVNFGYDEISFPVNKQYDEILHKFNETIIKLVKDLKMRDICENYGIEKKYLSICII